MKQVSIIFPNQLFRESPILKINCEVLILEDSLFFGNDKFHKLINHKNKLVFHRASMLAYKNYLEISGFKVLYIENKNNVSTVDYLSEFIKNKYQKINLIDPHDFLIMKRINNFTKSNKRSVPRRRLMDDEGYIRRAACICVDEAENRVRFFKLNF